MSDSNSVMSSSKGSSTEITSKSLKYSFAAAVGLFKAVIAFVLLYTANRLANRLGQTGLW